MLIHINNDASAVDAVQDAEPSNVFESSTSVKDAATITNLVRRLTVG